MTDDLIKKSLVKILVVKDLKSKAVFAHVVTQKGTDSEGYAIQKLVDDVKWLGYTKVLLKADNERAIAKLLTEALRVIKTDGVEVAREAPPAYDSRANGSIENAVKQVQGLLRTLKLSFEKCINGNTSDEHVVMSWMVEHVAFIFIANLRGSDGRTGFQRVRGKPFCKVLLGVMERCLYKLPIKGPEREASGKFGAC